MAGYFLCERVGEGSRQSVFVRVGEGSMAGCFLCERVGEGSMAW